MRWCLKQRQLQVKDVTVLQRLWRLKALRKAAGKGSLSNLRVETHLFSACTTAFSVFAKAKTSADVPTTVCPFPSKKLRSQRINWTPISISRQKGGLAIKTRLVLICFDSVSFSWVISYRAGQKHYTHRRPSPSQLACPTTTESSRCSVLSSQLSCAHTHARPDCARATRSAWKSAPAKSRLSTTKCCLKSGRVGSTVWKPNNTAIVAPSPVSQLVPKLWTFDSMAWFAKLL